MIPVSSCVWFPGVAAIVTGRGVGGGGGGGGHRSKGCGVRGNGKSPKTGRGGGENGLQYRIEFIVNC